MSLEYSCHCLERHKVLLGTKFGYIIFVRFSRTLLSASRLVKQQKCARKDAHL